jgi:hypothetical protein
MECPITKKAPHSGAAGIFERYQNLMDGLPNVLVLFPKAPDALLVYEVGPPNLNEKLVLPLGEVIVAEGGIFPSISSDDISRPFFSHARRYSFILGY